MSKSLFEMSLLSEAAYFEYANAGNQGALKGVKWMSAVRDFANLRFGMLYTRLNNATLLKW